MKTYAMVVTVFESDAIFSSIYVDSKLVKDAPRFFSSSVRAGYNVVRFLSLGKLHIGRLHVLAQSIGVLVCLPLLA